MIKKILMNLGYEENDIKKILENKQINNLKKSTLEKNIQEIWLNLILFGYTEEELIKITKTLPLMFCLSLENIFQKIYNLISLGYTKENIIRMTKKFPIIYSLGIDNIKQKIKDMMVLGYTKESAIEMTKKYPNLYSLGIENIKQKFEGIMSLGYTKEEAIKMTKDLPNIYSLSLENICQKLEFYDSIGLREVIVNDSKKLMQSVDLSYARYEFLKDKGIAITTSEYGKLFINQRQFESQHGITKDVLISLYNYQEKIGKKSSKDKK